MGNSDSQLQSKRHFGEEMQLNQIPLSAFEMLEKVIDPRYGEITVGEYIGKKEKVVIKEQMFDSTSKFEREYKELLSRLVGNHMNILQIYGYYHFKESHLCSSLHKLYIFVEYLKKDLGLEVKTRRLQNYPYTEQELWNLISDLINVMSYLQTLNVTHGCLKLNTIFLDSSKNTYKLADPGLFSNMSNYTLALSGGDTRGLYLCPRLLRNLETKATFPKYNAFKSDVFILGMVLLDVAFLSKHENIIEWETLTIRRDVLSECLNGLKACYSESLKNIISTMLVLEEERRPDFLKLSALLVECLEKRKRPNENDFATLESSKARVLKESNEAPQYPSVLTNLRKGGANTGISLQSKSQTLSTLSEADTPLKDIKNFKNNGDDSYQQAISLKREMEPGKNSLPSKAKISEYEENYNVSLGQFSSVRINAAPSETRANNPDYFSFGNQYYPSDHSFREQEDNYLKYNPQIQGFKMMPTPGNPLKLIDQGRGRDSQWNPVGSEPIKSGVYRELVKETYDDGSIYEGEKENGLRHGRGKFFYSDGGLYDGEWHGGRMEGWGILFYPNTRNMVAYEGQWVEDKFHGKGTVYNECTVKLNEPFNYKNFEELGDIWEKYEGDFREDCKDGIGTLYLSNGDRFTGKFVNDSVHGRGAYYKSDGTIISGEWMYNKLIKIF